MIDTTKTSLLISLWVYKPYGHWFLEYTCLDEIDERWHPKGSHDCLELPVAILLPPIMETRWWDWYQILEGLFKLSLVLHEIGVKT